MSTKLGTAYVDVGADFSRFDREVAAHMATAFGGEKIGKALSKAFTPDTSGLEQASRKLKDATRQLSLFSAGGEKAGGQFSLFGDEVGRTVEKATKQVEQATKKVNLFGRDGEASFRSVGSSARTADAQLKSLYSGISQRNISRALGEMGKSGGRAGREIEEGAKRGSNALRNLRRDSAGGRGGGIANALGAIGGELPGGVAAIGGLRIALVLVIPALFAFGGAAGAAASALVPLLGLAAGAGGILSGLAQGFGVLKLATSGIGAALKEQTSGQIKAGSSAINAAAQQRSAARAIQSAQDGLRDSLERVTSATEDLKDAQKNARTTQKALTAVRTSARRALVDMHAALDDAVLSEVSASLALQDAIQALADLGTTASQQELRVAVQDVTEALHGQMNAALGLLHAQKALDDLIKKSITDETAKANAVAALGRAQANLALVTADVNATYDERTHALTLVADATKVVNDANAASTVTDLDKADALMAVTNAQDGVVDAQNQAIATQKALVDLQSGPSDSAKTHALLDVAQAVQSLVEAQRDAARQTKDVAEADRLGVEQSKEVLDAKDAIVDANKRVRDAEQNVEDANRSVIRATQALSDAQLAANESMIKGAESAASLNQAMNSLPPAAQAFVRELISMKPKLDDLRQTAAQGFFPGATAGLRAAAGSFSEIKTVIGETSTVLGEFTRKTGELIGSPAFGKDIKTIGHDNAVVIDTLGEAFRHVLSAIRHVLIAAGPLTKWLADTINDWAQYAASSAKAGRETGKLGEFFKKTRDIASRLGDIIGHVVHGLWGLAGAGGVVGNDIWKSIDRLAKRFDDWANSVKGKKEIHEFFQKATDLAEQIAKALKEIVKGIAFVTLKFLPLTDALRVISPYIAELTAAFITVKLAMYAAAAASSALTAAMWLLNTPIALIALALAALAYGFYYAYTHSDTFKAIVDGALQAVGDKMKWLWNAAQDVFNWLKDHWPLLLGILTGPIGIAAAIIVSKWDWISNATTNVWNFISGFLGRVWNGLKWTVTTIFNGIASIIGGVWNAISAAASAAWGAFKTLASAAWDGVKFVIVNPIKAIVKVIGDVWDDVKAGASKAWKFISDGASSFADGIADAVVGAFKGVANLVIDFINDITSAINIIPGIPGEIGKIEHVGQSKPKAQPGKPGSNTQGVANKAQGGAYERTGGFVGAPITLMGEEAPAHPEWVIPTNPKYRPRAQMLLGQAARSIGLAAGGKHGGSLLGGIADALTKGGLGGVLSKGASFVLDKLPGVGDLPDWIKGTGSYVLGHVAAWIKKQIGRLVTGGGGGGGPVGAGVKGSIRGAIALAQEMGLAITSTTGGNHVQGSYHYQGRAADVAGSPALMAAFFKAALARYGSNLVELFYDPLGAIKNGARIPAIGGHSDHVHIALAQGGPYGGSFAQGGIVGGPIGAPATITAHGGEAVVPDGAGLVGALNRHSAELRALRHAGVSGVMASITDHVMQNGGQDAQRRRMTAGNPAVTAIFG